MTAYDDRTPETSDDEYSATVLASHWIQGPDPDEPGTLRMREEQEPEGPVPAFAGEPDGTVPAWAGVTRVEDAGPQATVPQQGPTPVEPATVRIPGQPGSGQTGPEPDRVEGTVLRFGPGVTAALAERTLRAVPAAPEAPAPRRRRGLRRYALPALVLLCVLAFLAWQRLGSSVQVRSLTVAARPAVLGCDATSDIVARVTTDGRPGTLTYRWIRSDGTASGVLRETLARGQREASLRLRWTFEGEGRLTGKADLRLLTPTPRTVTAQVTYACP